MARRKDACKPNPINLCLPDRTSLSSVRLFDHLTPKMKNVFSEAKKIKTDYHFEFCWAKDSGVYLRKDSGFPRVELSRMSRIYRKFYDKYMKSNLKYVCQKL